MKKIIILMFLAYGLKIDAATIGLQPTDISSVCRILETASFNIERNNRTVTNPVDRARITRVRDRLDNIAMEFSDDCML